MTVTEQKLNEIIEGIASNYKMKGSISTNALCDLLEKYDLTPAQIETVYKTLPESGIQIFDEDERERAGPRGEPAARRRMGRCDHRRERSRTRDRDPRPAGSAPVALSNFRPACTILS